MTPRPARAIALLAALATTGLALTACTDDGDDTAVPAPVSPSVPAASSVPAVPSVPAAPTTVVAPTPTASTSPSPSTSPTSSAPATAAASGPFGPACSSLPNGGNLPDEPLEQALADIPQLSQLAAAVGVANLAGQLDDLQGVTIFAPTDDAFASLGSDRLRTLLTNPSQLGQVLQYHVVDEQLDPQAVVGSHESLEGADVTVSGSGEDLTVDDEASVICGGITTSDATIYVIDSVLTLPS